MSKPDLLARLRARLTHPASADEILRVLRVPRLQRQAVKRQLRDLVAEGTLVRVRGNLYAWPRTGSATAPNAHRPPKSRLIGRFERDRTGQAYVVPFDRRSGSQVLISRAASSGAVSGQMVEVEITRHGAAGQPPRGSVLEVLGAVEEPGVDAAVVLRAYAIPDAHGEEALAEAARSTAAAGRLDSTGRTDFRDRVVITIDGEHARDFDDAISIDRLENGRFRLGVHIADVAHFVEAGGALDREAYDRGTSVYFPERAVHMFPEALATGVCSLNPHVDRLVQSCLMEVDRRGQVVHHEIHDGIIRSAARMTYTAVNAILTDRDPQMLAAYRELVPMFELMGELFGILNQRRRQRGSVDFDLPEPEVVLDTAGLVADIVPAERNVAHRLIEEFMLLANETVASHLEEAGMPSLYRVHEPPDALKIEEFEAFIRSLGFSLEAPPNEVKPRHFQALVQRIRGNPAERPIAFLMLRTMQKARYDAVNLGHFGLAARCYTHFTSPIRRYPDLVVHRLLRELRHTRVDAKRREALERGLPETGRHTSERERRADEAERELLQWKKVRFMAGRLGEIFDGYITGVAHFGLFVELVDHYVEGLVHVSTLAGDFYRYSESTHTLYGDRGGKAYRLGDRIRVQVARIDLDRRQIELTPAEAEPDEGHGARAGIHPRVRKESRLAGRAARHRGASRPGRRERAKRKRR